MLMSLQYGPVQLAATLPSRPQINSAKQRGHGKISTCSVDGICALKLASSQFHENQLPLHEYRQAHPYQCKKQERPFRTQCPLRSKIQRRASEQFDPPEAIRGRDKGLFYPSSKSHLERSLHNLELLPRPLPLLCSRGLAMNSAKSVFPSFFC